MYSKLRLGILETYIKDFDVISLCETKTDNIDTDAFPDYAIFTLKKSSPTHRHGGIHGISLLVKDHLAASTTILQNTVSENILWSKIDNDSLGIHIVVGSVYIPHENSLYYHDDIFDNVTEDIININNAVDLPIILIGDFNSRTGIIDDFIEIDDSIAIVAGIDNIENSIFNSKHNLKLLDIKTKRFNVDTTVNHNGNRLI